MKRIIRIVIICTFLLTSLGVLPALADPNDPPPIFLPLISGPLITVSGIVRDNSNYPVAGAQVIDVHGKTATTDLNGHYTLRVGKGPNTLAVTRNGYSIKPLSVNVTTSLSGVNFSAQVGCGNIVVNEQLAAGMGGWDFLSNQDGVEPGIDLVNFHSPPSSGRVGINPGIDDTVASTTRARSQVYHVPSNADEAYLGFWVFRNDPADVDFDRESVVLLDANNNEFATIVSTSNVPDAVWTYIEYPLSSLTGDDIKIEFRVTNDGIAGIATMYFDDVQLIICNTSCDNQIINSSFEITPTNTTVDTGWLYDGPQVVPPAYSGAQAHTGTYSMRTGIPPSVPGVITSTNTIAFTEVFQRDIPLPGDQSSALLTFWIYRLRPEGNIPPIEPVLPPEFKVPAEVPVLASPARLGPLAPTATPEEDWVYLYVLDDDGNFLEKPLWQRATNDPAWMLYWVDLSEFMGQQIELKFGTYNDGRGGAATMYIDDVVLGTCD